MRGDRRVVLTHFYRVFDGVYRHMRETRSAGVRLRVRLRVCFLDSQSHIFCFFFDPHPGAIRDPGRARVVCASPITRNVHLLPPSTV